MTSLGKKFLLAGLLGAISLFAGEARAALTATLNSITPATGGQAGQFNFNYTASLAPDDSFVNGDFFVIFDVAGFVSATAPTNFVVEPQLTTLLPPPNVILSTPDNPTLTNVRFRYTGATPLDTMTLTGFVIRSTFGFQTLDDFVGRVTKDAGLISLGTKSDSVGSVGVPAVPEPATMALAFSALPVLGLGALRRRKKQS